MSFAYMMGLAITVAGAVTCLRRGQANPWLWIILLCPPLGSIIYLAVEVIGGASTRLRFRRRLASADDERIARADVQRLDSAAAWSDFAGVLRARNRHADAAAAARKALDRDPRDISARYELGRSLLALGRAAEAIPPLEAVIAGDRGHDYGDGLLALGKAREASGDAVGARAAFEELAGRSCRPEVLFHLARLQERAGDRGAAAASLRRIVDEVESAPAFGRRAARPWLRRSRRRLRRLEG